MKRFLSLLFLSAIAPSFLCAATSVDTFLINTPAQAYSSTFSMRTDGLNWASAQVISSSITAVQSTFNTGSPSSATLSVVSNTVLSTANATGQLTMVSASVAAGTTGSAVVAFYTNNGNGVIRIIGPPGGLQFEIGGDVALGYVSSNTAANFATAVNVSSNTSLVTATQSGTNDYVTLTCMNVGTFCNGYSVTSSSTNQVSTAAFSGGANPVQVQVGSKAYLAGVDFAVGASTAAMASNLAAAIAASSATTNVDASAIASCPNNCGVVYTTYTVTGSVGNVTLASSNPLAISTSAPTLTGGYDNAWISISGTKLYANKNWYVGASTAKTADSIYAAINSSFTTVVSTDIGATAIIYTTTTADGVATNYAVLSSTPAALLWNSASMTGGIDPAWTINTSTITTSNNFTAAQPVLFHRNNNVLTPLAQNTTYYIINVTTGSSLMLATSQANALARTPIVFTSSAVVQGGDTYTLTPLPTTQTAALQWVVSNDGTNWSPYFTTPYNVTVSSNVIASTASVSGTLYSFDLGKIDYSWLGLSVTAPTALAGPVGLKVHLIGKE